MPVSRRDVLTMAAGAVVAANLPAAQPALPVQPPPTPAWAVGSPGEWNWRHIVARTEHAARRMFACDGCRDECDHDEMVEGCEFCALATDPDLEAKRVTEWDGKGDTDAADWLNAGFGYICDRCGGEPSADDAQVVDGVCVCDECMTLEDWDKANPGHARELRAEQANEMLADLGDAIAKLAPPSITDMIRAAVQRAVRDRNEYLETALAEHLNAGVTIDRIELRVHPGHTEVVVDGCPTHRVTIGSAHGPA